MELDEVFFKRKTIRKFLNKNVSNEDLEKIIKSALLAPSPKNRQPWKFYILNNEQKQYIVNLMYEWLNKYENKINSSVKGSAKQMEMANKAIIVYTPKYHSKNKKLYFKKPDYLALGAAIEHMNLKCFDLGLGCTWMCDTLYVDKEIDEYLGIKDLEQISTLIIGYPEEIPERRKRFSLNDVLIN